MIATDLPAHVPARPIIGQTGAPPPQGGAVSTVDNFGPGQMHSSSASNRAGFAVQPMPSAPLPSSAPDISPPSPAPRTGPPPEASLSAVTVLTPATAPLDRLGNALAVGQLVKNRVGTNKYEFGNDKLYRIVAFHADMVRLDPMKAPPHLEGRNLDPQVELPLRDLVGAEAREGDADPILVYEHKAYTQHTMLARFPDKSLAYKAPYAVKIAGVADVSVAVSSVKNQSGVEFKAGRRMYFSNCGVGRAALITGTFKGGRLSYVGTDGQAGVVKCDDATLQTPHGVKMNPSLATVCRERKILVRRENGFFAAVVKDVFGKRAVTFARVGSTEEAIASMCDTLVALAAGDSLNLVDKHQKKIGPGDRFCIGNDTSRRAHTAIDIYYSDWGHSWNRGHGHLALAAFEDGAALKFVNLREVAVQVMSPRLKIGDVISDGKCVGNFVSAFSDDQVELTTKPDGQTVFAKIADIGVKTERPAAFRDVSKTYFQGDDSIVRPTEFFVKDDGSYCFAVQSLDGTGRQFYVPSLCHEVERLEVDGRSYSPGDVILDRDGNPYLIEQTYNPGRYPGLMVWDDPSKKLSCGLVVDGRVFVTRSLTSAVHAESAVRRAIAARASDAAAASERTSLLHAVTHRTATTTRATAAVSAQVGAQTQVAAPHRAGLANVLHKSAWVVGTIATVAAAVVPISAAFGFIVWSVSMVGLALPFLVAAAFELGARRLRAPQDPSGIAASSSPALRAAQH